MPARLTPSLRALRTALRICSFLAAQLRICYLELPPLGSLQRPGLRSEYTPETGASKTAFLRNLYPDQATLPRVRRSRRI